MVQCTIVASLSINGCTLIWCTRIYFAISLFCICIFAVFVLYLCCICRVFMVYLSCIFSAEHSSQPINQWLHFNLVHSLTHPPLPLHFNESSFALYSPLPLRCKLEQTQSNCCCMKDKSVIWSKKKNIVDQTKGRQWSWPFVMIAPNFSTIFKSVLFWFISLLWNWCFYLQAIFECF